MLELEQVRLERAGRTVLADVEVSLEPGAMICLCGPNGAGKSSLIEVCAGDLVPSRGSVRLQGKVPGGLDAAELAWRRAVLSQNPALLHPFSVADVVALGHPTTAAEARAATLAELGAAELLPRTYTELSGGERRLVQLARVLLQGERAAARDIQPWLLLDEPVTQLDLARVQRVMQALQSRAERGWGILTVMHDLELASRHADRMLILARGRLLADGPPELALTPETLARGWHVNARTELETPGPGVRVRVSPASAGPDAVD